MNIKWEPSCRSTSTRFKSRHASFKYLSNFSDNLIKTDCPFSHFGENKLYTSEEQKREPLASLECISRLYLKIS